ncbi:MAG: ComF family protein [Archangium gephyra]|uniref:ComF family protein n=1 Tax=Archangium gephyra TaxID=48 RepID=A0A2W5T1U6_9BACT|nr:MAG: ComF family protein [Archangium gephyra]
MRWRAAFDAVADVLLPPQCAVCDEVLPVAGCFCERCSHEVLELPSVHCSRCAEPGAFDGGMCSRCSAGVPWEKAWAPFEHDGSVARAIHRFKYEDRSDLSRPLGLLLAATAADVLVKMPGVLVPLPLHDARYRQRGFDQAAMLTHVLATQEEREVSLDLLRRVKDTPRQVGLTEAQREANVRGAFVASEQARGLEVVLVDDVLTSGASAREACRVLKEVGAKRISVLTLARARREHA